MNTEEKKICSKCGGVMIFKFLISGYILKWTCTNCGESALIRLEKKE